MDINKVIEEYSKNEMRKLKSICFVLLKKIGGLNESDYDDFYSIANYTLWNAAETFDDSQNDSFDNFLKDCIYRKFKTEMTRRNRERRIPGKMIDRIDKPLSEDGNSTLVDIIESDFNVENEIKELSMNENVFNFINSLSPKQKEIAMLIIDGYDLPDIKNILNMSDVKFSRCVAAMATFDKRILLNSR